MGDAAGDPRDVVVFGLDGTLVAGDSFARFLRSLLTRRPARLAAALLSSPVWFPALRVPSTRMLAERYLVVLATVLLSEEAFAAAARDFAERHAGPAAGRTARAGLARLRERLDRGDRVLVATGCAAPLAQEVCAVIGLDGVEVVASTLPRRGVAPAQPVRGEGKLAALRAAGVEFPVAHAYSDSVADLPLLRSAVVPHLVDPSPREEPRLRRALGPDVEVLRWADPSFRTSEHRLSAVVSRRTRR